MPTATFAQLCGHLETVTDSSASVFDLYHDISCSSIHKHLAIQTFMDLFYDQGVFNIRDCCNNLMVLHNWLVEPSGNIGQSAIPITMDPSNCDIFSLVRDQWILDASNNNCDMDISANWGTCSYMNMVRELIPSGNLCNWTCLTCCALTAKELADVLNYEEYTNNGNVWPAGSVARTPVSPVKWGDEVILAVRFTNLNPCVDPIELRLHFFIGWREGWWGFCEPPGLLGAPQSQPGPGFWCAVSNGRLGTNLPSPEFPTTFQAPWGCPALPGTTDRLWIHRQNCCGVEPQIFKFLPPPWAPVPPAYWNLLIEGTGRPFVPLPRLPPSISNFPDGLCSHAAIDISANYLILGGSWLSAPFTDVLELKVITSGPPCSNTTWVTRWPQYIAANTVRPPHTPQYAFRFTFTPP